jgi:hypothetical protein
VNCDEAREALEAYVAADLDEMTASEVAEHLAGCSACAAQHDRLRTLVGDLKGLRDAYVPREVFDMSEIRNDAPARSRWGWKLVTATALVLAALSLSVLTIPAVAQTLKVLPVSEKLDSLQAENTKLKADNDNLETRVQELEVKVKAIEGQNVPVVETADPRLSDEVNNAVQSLAMRFINAQYAGDLKTMRELGTAKLQADLAKHPDVYIRQGGKVNFAQMTDVSMSGDTYLLFVRLMDANEWTDSQYQEDFEIKKVGDTYLVDFMGMDA